MAQKQSGSVPRENNGSNSLMFAAQNGHLEVLKWMQGLPQFENLITGKGSDGWNPLMLAAENGHLEVLKWMQDLPQFENLITEKKNNGSRYRVFLDL